ncbi:MAG TPA: nucleotide exchange factor GrpE [bacterium]|nr:nucleotide exchange factor GrpE [bacterium]
MKKTNNDANLTENKETTRTLEREIEELKQGWQRTQADFINYKKQVTLEKEKSVLSAQATIIEGILPILDNFQLAAKHIPQDLRENSWVSGVVQIERQLQSTLENVGLTKIVSLDQTFDPTLHEAIEHIESSKPDNIIVEEVAAGYILNGKVLRPAKVKVSKNIPR